MINMLILFLKTTFITRLKRRICFQRGFSRSSASQPSFTGRSLTQQWQLKWLNTNQQIPCNGAYSFRNSSWNLNLHFFLYNYSMVCINDRSSLVWLSGYLKLILSADTRFTALLPRPTNTVSFFSPFCQLVWSFCEWVTFWRMKYYGRVSTKQANLLPLWHSSPVERGFSVRTNFVAVLGPGKGPGSSFEHS